MTAQNIPDYLVQTPQESNDNPPNPATPIGQTNPPEGILNNTAVQQPHKKKLLITLVVVIIGVVGLVGWLTLFVKGNKETPRVSSKDSVSASVVRPDMNYVGPNGWTVHTVNTGRNTVKTYTSPDKSGAKIKLILQESASRTNEDNLTATSELKEIKLQSALFGDQYTAQYDGATNVVTSFHLRVYFDVLMEEKYYNQSKYQQVYQAFLDSFVPNGTTNNQ